MQRRAGLWAALAAWCAVLAAPFSGAADPLPLDAFFSKLRIDSAALSPSGRYVATLQGTGDFSAVIVHDLQTGADTAAMAFKGDQYFLDWVRWKGDDRLVVGVTVLKLYRFGKSVDSEIYDYDYGRYMVAAGRSGEGLVVMFRDDKHTAHRSRPFVDLLDILRNDPDHVLAAAPDSFGVSNVWKVDIHSGAATVVESGNPATVGWNVDTDGNVVVRYQQRGLSTVLEGRAPGHKDWSQIVRLRRTELRKTLADFEVLGAADKPGQIYVGVKPKSPAEGDFRTLRIYDLASKTLSAPVWPPLQHDIVNVVYRGNTTELAGVCYTTDVYVCDFKDKDLQANVRGISRFFDNDRNIVRTSTSDDGRWWLLKVSGPADPGSLYLYDWKNKKIEELGVHHPGLDGDRLGTMQRYSYKASDGVEIHGYVTLPPGAPGGPLPMVVVPHGGPEERDTYDYDLWAQVLATRGYLVFQPNFRGSSGYGVSFAESGYGQWGQRMQDDITDGVRKLIAEGRADPARICIFGGSYGGYAALIGGVRNPDLYKCVVSRAGIADLVTFQRSNRRKADGVDDPAYVYALKAIGDPDKDEARLRANSAASYAKTYGPPVLLIHGLDDKIVPVDQSYEMLSVLKSAHKDVRLVTYRNEDHSDWLPEHEEASMKEILAFLQAHIGGQAPSGAKP